MALVPAEVKSDPPLPIVDTDVVPRLITQIATGDTVAALRASEKRRELAELATGVGVFELDLAGNGVNFDVTDQKRAEAALKAARSAFGSRPKRWPGSSMTGTPPQITWNGLAARRRSWASGWTGLTGRPQYPDWRPGPG